MGFRMTEKKVAIVTGASRGIGKACALILAQSGYDVVINFAGNEEAAKETVDALKVLGSDSCAYKFDVSDYDASVNAVDEIYKKYGRIDVLVNNAGITKDGLLMRMSKENWNSVITTNLSSIFNMTQPVVKIMMKQKSGSIINMSSVSGVWGNAGQTNYASSKAGVIGFTKSLAKEVASRGIRVNAVAPGFIQTDMTKNLDTDKILEHIAMKRLGEPSDIAKAVKFLASDATYITGQVLCVDGGLVM